MRSWSDDELSETDSLEATLPADENKLDAKQVDAYVPVHFHTKITELGTLELWCVGNSPDERWKLEFSVRDDATMNPSPLAGEGQG